MDQMFFYSNLSFFDRNAELFIKFSNVSIINKKLEKNDLFNTKFKLLLALTLLF
jgi:hypothetical protein